MISNMCNTDGTHDTSTLSTNTPPRHGYHTYSNGIQMIFPCISAILQPAHYILSSCYAASHCTSPSIKHRGLINFSPYSLHASGLLRQKDVIKVTKILTGTWTFHFQILPKLSSSLGTTVLSGTWTSAKKCFYIQLWTQGHYICFQDKKCRF